MTQMLNDLVATAKEDKLVAASLIAVLISAALPIIALIVRISTN